MNTLQILREGRERLARGWCVGSRGETSSGFYCDGYSPNAVRWCALGALDASLGRFVDSDNEAVRALEAEVPSDHWVRTRFHEPSSIVAQFNNNTSQAEVLALFDRTIAKLEGSRGLDPAFVKFRESLREYADA